MPDQDLSALPDEELNRLAAVEVLKWNDSALARELREWDPTHDMNDAKALDAAFGDDVMFFVNRAVKRPEGQPWYCERWCPERLEKLAAVYGPTEERVRVISAILAHRAKEGSSDAR